MGIYLPKEWLVPCRIDRIHVHWTAGPRKSRPDEHQHYNFVLDQDLTINRGVSIDKNGRVIGSDFRPGFDYAAHTRAANSFAGGYSMAGMRLSQEPTASRPFILGPDPLTEPQWSRMIIHVAQLCFAYGIKPGLKTVLSHAEVQMNLGIKQNAKWDLTLLPWQKDQSLFNTARKVGNLMRAEVTKILIEGAFP